MNETILLHANSASAELQYLGAYHWKSSGKRRRKAAPKLTVERLANSFRPWLSRINSNRGVGLGQSFGESSAGWHWDFGRYRPESGLSKAINYCLNCWDNLRTFLKRGDMDPDTNKIQRLIRTFVWERS